MKTKKKIKVAAKNVAKKAKLLVGKANAKTRKAVRSLKKEWKKGRPHRKEYEKELKNAVNLVSKDVIRIGTDVINTIRDDIRKVKRKN
ncbi:MAG: hypothetical protein WC631_01315 [Candidatus Paceibacterota bacterium]|jgi:hypothetical protein